MDKQDIAYFCHKNLKSIRNMKTHRMKTAIMALILAMAGSGCSRQDAIEKHQTHRDEVVNVADRLHAWGTEEELLIGKWPRLKVGKRFIILVDYDSPDQLIRLFNRKDLHFQGGFGEQGQGPNELTMIGTVCEDANGRLLVPDHGKLKIFSYDADSVLADPQGYVPQVKLSLDNTLFPANYKYINDTLCYAAIIQPTSVSTFDQHYGIWNPQTGTLKKFAYRHPDIHKRRGTFDVSMNERLLVEVSSIYDLMSIFDLEGSLISNVYGPDWGRTHLSTFQGVAVTSRGIITSYSGDDYLQSRGAQRLHLFDLKGNYLKTIDLGRTLLDFCYDETYHRLLLSFDHEMQLGWLDLSVLF